MRYVYLAGPMTGLTLADAKFWRNGIKMRLGDGFNPRKPGSCNTIDPTRGLERILETDERIGIDQSPDKISKHAELQPGFFVERCRRDVLRCDIVLVNLLTEPQGVGTFFELAWAWQAKKPIFALRDCSARTPLAFSPWVTQALVAESTSIEEICHTIRMSS